MSQDEIESNAEFVRQVMAQNLVCEKAEREYNAAKDISLGRKKNLDEQRAKLAEIISGFNKVDPQKKLPFEDAPTPPPATKSDIQLGKDPEPIVTSLPEIKSEAASIETLDLLSPVVTALVHAGIDTVPKFIDLVECKNEAYPQGPEDIPKLGKKAIKQIAAVYASLQSLGSPEYDPPLPVEPVPGAPKPVVNHGGEVLAETTGKVEKVESIEIEEPTQPTEVSGDSGKVRIKSLIDIDGAIKSGEEYLADMVGGEACITIDGEPVVLTDEEFQRV